MHTHRQYVVVIELGEVQREYLTGLLQVVSQGPGEPQTQAHLGNLRRYAGT